MENMNRVKALNVLFVAVIIGFVITEILVLIITFLSEKLGYTPNKVQLSILLCSVTTYIAGRIISLKEYEDETT